MNEDVFAILRAYPQIYLACHVEHRTRGTSTTGLTSRDATILAHVADGGTTPSRLARHLGISASTLSPALARLASLGLLTAEAGASDRRGKVLRLTDAGRSAVAAGSVLNPDRVAAVLAALSAAERRRAVQGLALLADAARRYRFSPQEPADERETRDDRGPRNARGSRSTGVRGRRRAAS